MRYKIKIFSYAWIKILVLLNMLFCLETTISTEKRVSKILYCNNPNNRKPEMRISLEKKFLKETYPSAVDYFVLINDNYERTVPFWDLNVYMANEKCKNFAR